MCPVQNYVSIVMYEGGKRGDLQPSTRVVSFQRDDEVAGARQHGDISSRRVTGVERWGS
jgi:hypothetical protein